MRTLTLVGALSLVSACGAPTANQAKVRLGPSMTGQWTATDTAHQVMTLDLTQTGDTVTGQGLLGSEILSVAGHNFRSPPCHGLPCQAAPSPALTIADAAADTLLVIGLFVPNDTDAVSIQFARASGPPPGFPFYIDTVPVGLVRRPAPSI